jgi:hypothetical protein
MPGHTVVLVRRAATFRHDARRGVEHNPPDSLGSARTWRRNSSSSQVSSRRPSPSQSRPPHPSGKSRPRTGSWGRCRPSGARSSCSLIHALTACTASVPSMPAQAPSDPSTRKSPSRTSTLRVSTEDASSGPREERRHHSTSSSTSTLRVRAGSSSR